MSDDASQDGGSPAGRDESSHDQRVVGSVTGAPRNDVNGSRSPDDAWPIAGAPGSPAPTAPEAVTPARLRTRHLLGLLCFRAESIRAAAATPWSLAAGLLLVLSGGIARHYDKADLVAEWPLLLRGVAISTMNATLLFLLCCTIMPLRKPWPVGRAYMGFLGVFWLTAPMAWLYGIPYERWMPASHAASWKYLTLAVVSVWRVALMARVVSVLCNLAGGAALVLVLALADTLAFFALFEKGMAIAASMGGVHMSEAELAESTAAEMALSFSCLLWPVLFIALIVVWARQRGAWTLARPEVRSAPVGPVAVAAAGLLMWVGVAWPGHPALRREREVEMHLRSADATEAHRILSGIDMHAMPPGWAIAEEDVGEVLWELLEMHESRPLPAEVVSQLIPIVHERATGSLDYYVFSNVPWRAMPRALDNAHVQGPEVPQRAQRWLEFLVRHDNELSPEDRAGMIEIIRRADPGSEGSTEGAAEPGGGG